MGGVALTPAGAVLAGADGPVTAVTFDAGGGRVAAGCAGGVALVWDVVTGEVVHRLVGHTDPVSAVAFRDDDLLCTAGEDGTVRVWDPGSGEELHRLAGHTGAVRDLAVARDPATSGERPATWLATVGDDGAVRVWDLVTGAQLHRFMEHDAPLHAVACGTDGTLAAGGDDGVVQVWMLATATVVQRRRPQLMDSIGRVRSLAFDPAGARLAIGGHGFTVVLWDPRSGQETHLPTEVGYPVLSMAFSPDGAFVATASRATAVRLWDATTTVSHGDIAVGTELCAPAYHPIMATAVGISPDGRRLATGGHDGATRIWRMTPAAPVTATVDAPRHRVRCVPGATLTGHRGRVRRIGFAPDGGSVATGGSDGTVRVWDPATGAERARLVVTDAAGTFLAEAGEDAQVPLWLLISSPNDVAFSPDGARLAIACGSNGVLLFDLDTGTRTWQRTVTAFGGDAHPVAADAVEFVGGGALVTAFADHTIRMLDTGTGAERHRLDIDEFVGFASLAVDRDATVVAVAGDGRDVTVRLLHLATGADLGGLVGHDGHVNAVALSPDGTLLATAGDDHTVRLWSTATWVPHRVLSGHTAGIRGVAFAGSGDLLVSWGPDGVRLWDPDSGAEIGGIDDAELIGAPVAVSPDGRRIAVAVTDRHVRLWDVTPA